MRDERDMGIAVSGYKGHMGLMFIERRMSMLGYHICGCYIWVR